jgi:SPP1 family predicted phage head-tail adaptor
MVTGDLRERVTLQSATSTADDYGGRAKTWSTWATVQAAVRPLGAREQLAAAAIGSHGAYELEIYTRAGVTPGMRALWTPFRASAAKTLEIHGVQPHPTNRDRLVLACGEVI